MQKSKSSLIFMASFGTVIEWAEYTFYAYLAFFLAPVFFPKADPYAALLMAYGSFAVGYFIRPLGALFFGHIGDRIGRKPAFMYAILLMGLATAGIGLMPSYATWGIGAPIGLICCRILQGFSMGGEYQGAGIYILEQPTKTPYLQGSFIAAASAFGMAVGASTASVITLAGMPAWAWRVPFLLGGLACGFVYLLRRNLPESRVFLDNKAVPTRHPFVTVIRDYKAGILRVVAIAALIGVHVYIANVYWATFLIRSVGLAPSYATQLSVLAELLVALLTPCMGYLADKGNGLKQFRYGAALIACLCPCMFWLSRQGTPLALGLALGIFVIGQSIICGPLFRMMFEIFPPAVRYTGLSFSWNLSAALFSSTAPMIATYADQRWPGGYGPSLYVSLIALGALLVLHSTRKLGSPLAHK